MLRGWSRIASGIFIVLAATSVHAAEVAELNFRMITNAASANDMSPDGRYVVGERFNGTLYLWDTVSNVFTTLPAGALAAVAVSDDGTVVLGDMIDPRSGDEVAGIWRKGSNTWTSLGYLPNANTCPSRSNGYELSGDGAVAVGLSWDGCDGRGFRWTKATGMVELEPLANGGNRASVVSGDGNVLAGFAQGSFSRTPTFWESSGDGELLDPPSGDAVGEIHGINDAGTILLGEWNGDAVMWTYPSLTRTVIGDGSILPGWSGIPQDIADDGTVVGFDILLGNRRAWIQPGGAGPLQELAAFVTGHGGIIPAGVNVHVAQAISTDATTIIGHGTNTGAWIVKIEYEAPACMGDVVSSGTFQPPADGAVDGADLAYLLGEWGTNPGSAADFVSSATFQPPPDGVVDAADLAALLGAWGRCD